jgi:hypothetical protein
VSQWLARGHPDPHPGSWAPEHAWFRDMSGFLGSRPCAASYSMEAAQGARAYPDWGKVGKANLRPFAAFCVSDRCHCVTAMHGQLAHKDRRTTLMVALGAPPLLYRFPCGRNCRCSLWASNALEPLTVRHGKTAIPLDDDSPCVQCCL